jgi:hypothetical protein
VRTVKKEIILVLAFIAALAAATIALPSSDGADDEPAEQTFLLDYGNGQTQWFVLTGTVLGSAIEDALYDAKIPFNDTNNILTVDGIKPVVIGDTECGWQFYIYNDGWKVMDYDHSASYDGSYIAIGYYPDGYYPTVNPAHKTAYTAMHVDALNSGSIYNYDGEYTAAKIAYKYFDSKIAPSSYASPLIVDDHMILKMQDYK